MYAMTYIDPEMRELLEALGKAIVPRKRRQAAVRTNRHVPYYTDARYKRF